MSTTLRWGILGTGNIARQFAAGVGSSRRGAIAAVASRDPAAAETFARTYRVPVALGGYDALLQRADVDIVYISLPNSMHHPWTLAALRAGKHVLCEKPLASNTAEAQEMFDAAGRAGKLLIEAFMYRSHPQTLAVIDAVNAGAIGQLQLIRTNFCYRTRRIDDNIRFSRSLAGGGLMDVGCYCIDFSRLFAGCEPSDVQVAGRIHPSGVDDLAMGMMSFPNGVFANFACGMTVQSDNTAYLCGSEGYIQIPVPWKPPSAGASFTIAHGVPPRLDAVGQPPPAVRPSETRVIDCGQDLYAVEADDVASSLLDGAPPRISAQDSLGNMRILDAMRKTLGIL